MNKRGLSLVEALIAAGIILLIGGMAVFVAVDMRRRSRDTQRVSDIRQVQALLERYRSENASYPASTDGLAGAKDLKTTFTYKPSPDNCGPNLETTCGRYSIAFTLEGRVGTLTGGNCLATPENLTCGPKT